MKRIGAQKIQKSVTRRVLNVITYVLLTLIILAALIVSVIAIQSRRTGSTPSLGGLQLLKVVSGSMEPTIHTGSVIVIKEIDPAQLKLGDVITFRSVEYDSQLVTHRITNIEDSPDKGLIFTTRGDANDSDDMTPLPASQIRGTAVFSIPLLGYAMNFLQSREGLLVLIIVPGIYLAVYEIKQIRKNIRSLKEKKAGQAKNAIEE